MTKKLSIIASDSDITIVTNYCILYAKQYIYLEKLKVKINEQVSM